LQSDPALQQFKDVAGLAKAYRDTKAMVGRSIQIPSSEATPEQKKAALEKLIKHFPEVVVKPDSTDDQALALFRQSIGVPKEPTEYGEIEGIPAERLDLFRKAAHEAGIPKQAFEQTLSKVVEAEKAQLAQMQQAQAAEIGQLRNEWGDSYASRVQRAARVAELTGAPQELVEAAKAGTVGASTLRWLDKLAESVSGTGAEIAGQVGGVEGDTRMELIQKRDDLIAKMQAGRFGPQEYEAMQQRLLQYSEQIAALS